jgi:hypothetical protein
MVRGMQSYPLHVLREVDSHSPAFAANEVLGTITHKCVCAFLGMTSTLAVIINNCVLDSL